MILLKMRFDNHSCQWFGNVRSRLQTTIEGLKGKLRDRCGTSVKSMQLQLYDFEDKIVAECLQDSRPLGYYAPIDGYVHLTLIC